jgi:uncharacterized protein YlaN (UPF0358 family)
VFHQLYLPDIEEQHFEEMRETILNEIEPSWVPYMDPYIPNQSETQNMIAGLSSQDTMPQLPLYEYSLPDQIYDFSELQLLTEPSEPKTLIDICEKQLEPIEENPEVIEHSEPILL